MIIIYEEEVIEVATYLPCRLNGGVEGKLGPGREGGEDLGQNAQLDVMGDL